MICVKNGRKFPLSPKHPEHMFSGCDKYFPVDSLACGKDARRSRHLTELFGEDWYECDDQEPGSATETVKSATAAPVSRKA